MQNLTYLAVFEPSTDGSYSIYFPDLPGCISVGNNLEEAARMAKDNERVKTNITLPAWLKRIAEEQKVNYSRLLETALMDYLQIPMSGRQ